MKKDSDCVPSRGRQEGVSKMIWVAIEDADTWEIDEFEETTREHVLYLLDGYKADLSDPAKFRMRESENGLHVVYEGVTYKGGFGYNILVARKFIVL